MNIKKSIFVVALLCVLLIAGNAWAEDIEINERNFPDPVFRKFVAEQLDDGMGSDTAGDGILGDTELQAWTIDVDYWTSYKGTYYRGIKSLEGIRYFTQLQTLKCSNQKLTALNLGDIGSNYSPALQSLTTLRCEGNELTFLNVEGCKRLSTLYCGSNNFGDYQLDLSSTNISSLNCDNNPDLHVTLPERASDKLGVAYLSCNNIGSVGPLNSKTLGGYLRSIKCSNASLTALDLSDAKYVEEIDVSNNPNLKNIIWDMESQGMTFYGISSINISGTNIDVQELIDILSERSGNPRYFYANSMVNGLGTLDVSKFTNLSFLYLQSNGMYSVTLPASSYSYCYIHLESNDLTALPAIPQNTESLNLYVANNAITSIGNLPDGIEELDLSHNNLTNVDVSNLIKLEELNLSYNALTADKILLPLSIDIGLWGNRVQINLAHNKLTALPAIPPQVSYLDVSGNELTAVDVSKFTRLYELYVGENKLTALDTTANSELQSLAVAYNKDMETLLFSSDINRLDISGTKVPWKIIEPLEYLKFFYADAMEYDLAKVDLRSKDILVIHISNNGDGLKELHVASSEPGWSHEIYAFNNSLTHFDVPGGAAWLKLYDNHLTSLDLTPCISSKSGESWLEEADISNQTVVATQKLSKSFSFKNLVGSNYVKNIQDVQGYDSKGVTIKTTYNNGTATFASTPVKITYNYNTGCPIWGESDNLLLPVTVTNTGSTPSPETPDPEEPVLSFTTESVDVIAGEEMTAFVITSDTEVTWSTSGTLPKGLKGSAAADKLSYTIAGIPDLSSLGKNYSEKTFKYTVTAKNSSKKTASANLTFVVAPSDKRPVITTSALPNGILNEDYSFQVTASGNESEWSAKSLPKGLAIDKETGIISGKPTKTGTSKVTITAKNNYGTFTTPTINLIVNELPSITTKNLKDGNSGKSYSATLSAKGTKPTSGRKSFRWWWTAPDELTAATPSAFKIDEWTGKITGTTTLSGRFNVTVFVSNDIGTASKDFSLRIKGVAPSIKGSLPSKNNIIHEPYEAIFTATGTTPITWELEGVLPGGLSFDFDAEAATATLGGIPEEACKNFNLTLTASNDTKKVSKKLKLTINAKAPQILTTTLKTAVSGDSYNATIIVSGDPIPTVTLKGLPDGLSFDQVDEQVTITGTPHPKKDGKVSVTVTAVNAAKKVTKTLKLNVVSVPKITTSDSDLKHATLNKSYSATLKATGTKTIKWEVSGLPDGWKFSNGKITGTPKELVNIEFTVTAKNDYGEDSKAFTIVVDDNNKKKSAAPEILDLRESNDYIDVTNDENDKDDESKSFEIIVVRQRDADDLTNEEISKLKDYKIAAILPEIKVQESGQYDLETEINEEIQTGAKLFWFAFADRENSDDDDIVEFYNSEGEEVTSVPENHLITLSAWFNEGVIYKPVIAVKSE